MLYYDTYQNALLWKHKWSPFLPPNWILTVHESKEYVSWWITREKHIHPFILNNPQYILLQNGKKSSEPRVWHTSVSSSCSCLSLGRCLFYYLQSSAIEFLASGRKTPANAHNSTCIGQYHIETVKISTCRGETENNGCLSKIQWIQFKWCIMHHYV